MCKNSLAAGGAYDAPPDPPVGWGGDTSLQTPPRRRLHSTRAFGTRTTPRKCLVTGLMDWDGQTADGRTDEEQCAVMLRCGRAAQ